MALALWMAAGVHVLHAQTLVIGEAWVRATVAGQKATGAFMKITSPEGARLLSVSTPLTSLAEIHEMKMDGDVMRMRAVDGLDLPAGQTVELRPGGYHIMLMDLKAPLTADSTMPLKLTFVDRQGTRREESIQIPVRLAPPSGAMPQHDHGMMH